MKKAKARATALAKSKRNKSRKVKTWYDTYCEQCRKDDREPWTLRVWAAVEVERSTGAKRKELLHFLAR